MYLNLKQRRQIADEAGLAYGGKDDEGEDIFIGTDEEWQAFRIMEKQMEDDLDNPSEGMPWHPDYSPLPHIKINQIPKL